jgi:hypothetical protein
MEQCRPVSLLIVCLLLSVPFASAEERRQYSSFVVFGTSLSDSGNAFAHAVLDGEICCLEPDGRTHFNKLLFRRDWPFFYAFDVLSIEGDDVRRAPSARECNLCGSEL